MGLLPFFFLTTKVSSASSVSSSSLGAGLLAAGVAGTGILDMSATGVTITASEGRGVAEFVSDNYCKD